MDENLNEQKTNEVEENNLPTEEINETEGIKIANDVVAVIAGIAVSEVSGVYGTVGGFAGGLTEALKGKKNLAKGIKVETTDKKAKIDVSIIVEYGSRIPDVAFEIQNKVKKSVETMTGLNVEEVNVHVQGVNTDSLNKNLSIEEGKQEEVEENKAETETEEKQM